MKLLQLTGRNFGPFFGDFSFSLKDRGLVLVQGVNQASSSSDSNGSGKSMLLESIAWCQYGKTIRFDLMNERTGDQIINNKSKKDCFVSLKIEAGNSIIDITRYRKHKTHKNSVQVTVDGVDRTLGTNKETDALIVDLLGVDFRTFIRSVYFHPQFVQPFPTLTDKEIKDIFEKILGLEDLKKVADAVRGRKTIARNDISIIENKISMLEASSSTSALEILNSKDRKDKFEVDRENKLKAAQNEKIAAEKELEGESDLLRRENELLDDIAAKEDKIQKSEIITKMISDFNTKCHGLTLKKTSKEQEISNCNTLIGSVVADVALTNKRAGLDIETNRLANERKSALAIASNSESLIGKPCGECGKPYQSEDMADVISKQKELAEKLADKITEKNESADVCNLEIKQNIEAKKSKLEIQKSEAVGQLEIIEREISATNDERVKLETLSNKRQELMQELQTAKNDLAAVTSQKSIFDHHRASIASIEERLEAIKSEANPYEADIVRWKKKEKEENEQIEEERKLLNDNVSKMKYLEILDQAYGRSGLKSHILETITPALNQKANEYALSLTDGDVRISFSTVKQNKDKSFSEKFSVTVQNAAGAESYLGNSSGEQKKIDLAIGLALADLVAARSSKVIDLWVADEIAESLDPTALERVVEILREKAKQTGTVLVISHTNMRDHIPNVVEIVKKQNGSIIEDSLVDATSSMEAA